MRKHENVKGSDMTSLLFCIYPPLRVSIPQDRVVALIVLNYTLKVVAVDLDGNN